MTEKNDFYDWEPAERDEQEQTSSRDLNSERPGAQFERYLNEYDELLKKDDAGEEINLERAEFIEKMLIEKGLSKAIYKRRFCGYD